MSYHLTARGSFRGPRLPETAQAICVTALPPVKNSRPLAICHCGKRHVAVRQSREAAQHRPMIFRVIHVTALDAKERCTIFPPSSFSLTVCGYS